ncbi:MAG: PQQ-binding-like beta-propeller repeat protein [Planctomycetes bacterium]|jgi:outer membrane protein assembly factor BamB/tetratricopeptide (TPR) repeat protein|nr:PQQ-binding-like beta-propeller repeat protein [Planctomycetota bacterium]
MADNREVLNEAEVEFLLAGDDDAPTTSPATAPAEAEAQTVTMRGDLEQINLADIFQTLSMSKMEGVLRLRNPLEERQIHCRDGVVQILVPNRIATRRLGQRLVQAGLVEVEQLRAALVNQRKEKKPLGEMLIGAGLVTREQIEGVIGMQVSEDLFNLFTWRHGTFEFFKGPLATDAQRAAFASCPEFEVNSLLLEVARRSDEWESILDSLGSLDEVPERIAEPADESALDENHRTLMASVDARHTYRELAEQTTSGLFEVSRAARDLVNGGLLANVADEQLVAVATELAASDHGKRALVLLQTLRDRPGERALEILQGMAAALEKAGERRLAGALLLEAAQRQSDPQAAVDLARAARDLSPYDPGTLSYLRTVLVAHGASDSPELERVTTDLLDALIDGDLVSTALEIVADARATGTVRPQVLAREARARQKARDPQGAAAALLELAESYDALGDRQRALEAYEALLRVDRSRKDIAKLVALRKQTRAGRIVRLVSTLAGVLMLGAMGIVFWQQQNFNRDSQQADAEISELLSKGDRDGARASWEQWREALGECEPIEDLRNRIAFAEAAEQGRQQKLQRARINEQFTQAAEALAKGELAAALTIYRRLWNIPTVRDEVAGVTENRLTVAFDQITLTSKSLLSRLPPPPSALLDRRGLLTNLSDLEAFCSPVTLRLYSELQQLSADRQLPDFLSPAIHERIRGLAAPEIAAGFAKASALALAYSEALQRNDHQRRLDPLFKAAVQREAAHDFAAALELYRELENQPVSDANLRNHFRERVARNATIVKLMTELEAATKTGDFATAQQHLRALAEAFGDVPFAKIVRLPLKIESRPAGGRITCNGTEVGVTPMILSRVPAESLELEVSLPGFRGARTTITGAEVGNWQANLSMPAAREWQHASVIELPPAVGPNGTLYFADRSGSVVALAPENKQALWTFRSEDLSGLLSRPWLAGDLVLVASLDGELRALRRDTGELAWSLPDVPTEGGVVLVDRFLALATTDRKLRVFDLNDRRQTSIDLPEAVHAGLLSHGSTLVAVGERGRVRAFSLPALSTTWQQDLSGLTNPSAAVGKNVLVIADEVGNVIGLDLATGAVRWRHQLEEEVAGAPAMVDGDVLLTTPRAIIRFDAALGTERARVACSNSTWQGEPLLVGNRLVVPVADGSLQVLDARDCSQLYSLVEGRRCRPVLAGDRLLLLGPDRKVYFMPPLR